MKNHFLAPAFGQRRHAKRKAEEAAARGAQGHDTGFMPGSSKQARHAAAAAAGAAARGAQGHDTGLMPGSERQARHAAAAAAGAAARGAQGHDTGFMPGSDNQAAKAAAAAASAAARGAQGHDTGFMPGSDNQAAKAAAAAAAVAANTALMERMARSANATSYTYRGVSVLDACDRLLAMKTHDGNDLASGYGYFGGLYPPYTVPKPGERHGYPRGAGGLSGGDPTHKLCGANGPCTGRIDVLLFVADDTQPGAQSSASASCFPLLFLFLFLHLRFRILH